MGEKIKMEVKIRGRYYTIVADEPEEYVYKICSYVDREVSRIANMNPRLGTEMSSILTAINASDEYFKAIAREDNLRKQILEYEKENRELEEKKRRLENELAELKNEGKINENE